MNGTDQVEAMKKLSETLREEQARKNREKYPITSSMFENLKAQIIQEFGRFEDGDLKVMKTDEVSR